MFSQHSFLYVEDDPSCREIVELILTNTMGVQKLRIFENSEDFASHLDGLDDRPDVILLDIHMKPISGFEMLKILRAKPEYAGAIIIALTASVMSDEIDRLKVSGFNGAIGKPLKIREVPGLIARIIEGEAVWHIS